MNDEIKEILEFKENADYKKLSCDEIKVLKDYITNLQQKVKHYEETQTFGDYVKEVNLLVDYKTRIEKALEYGNSCINKDLDLETLDEPYKTTFKTAYEIHNNYLDILKGEDNE